MLSRFCLFCFFIKINILYSFYKIIVNFFMQKFGYPNHAMRPAEQTRETEKNSEPYEEHIACSDKGALFVKDTSVIWYNK